LGELDATQKQILSLLDLPPEDITTYRRVCGT
jgi:hypothetical protein